MAGFFQDLLKGAVGGFFGSDYLRDYTHASKTFRPNAYQNAPKFKFLFHTYFTINSETGVSPQQNIGLLVRDVKLPSYTFNTVQLNQYNRKRIIQTKIKYDPITITFHDDNGDTITKLWESYYTYYYQDGTKPQVQFAGNRGGAPRATVQGGGTRGNNLVAYDQKTQYVDSITGNDDWGYIGSTSKPAPDGSPVKAPFFKNITIFGFNQHNFTAYSLINPVITNFQHDTYSYDGNDTMKNTMTLDYETVVYNYGSIDGRKPSDIVTGFGLEANYDRRLSPIASLGSNGKILGQGGLIDSAGGALKKIASGDASGVLQLGQLIYNNKGRDLKGALLTDVKTMAIDAARNIPTNTRNAQFDIPTAASTPGPLGTAGSPTIGGVTSGITAVGEKVAGGVVNGIVGYGQNLGTALKKSLPGGG